MNYWARVIKVDWRKKEKFAEKRWTMPPIHWKWMNKKMNLLFLARSLARSLSHTLSSMHKRMSIRGCSYIQLWKEYAFFTSRIPLCINLGWFYFLFGVWMTSNESVWNVTFLYVLRHINVIYWTVCAAILQTSKICTAQFLLFYIFLLFIFQVCNASKCTHFPWGEHIQM